MLHVISARCVAHDLHTIAPGPLERACWRRFAALWGDCKKSRIAPLNAIIIIIIIIKVSGMCLPLWLDEKRSHRQKSQPKWWTQGYRWEHRRRRNQTRWLSIMYSKSFCTGHANCSTKFFHLAISNLNHFVSLSLASLAGGSQGQRKQNVWVNFLVHFPADQDETWCDVKAI